MALKHRVVTLDHHMDEDELQQQWKQGYELVSVAAWAHLNCGCGVTGPTFHHTLVYKGGLGATGAVRRR